MPNVKQNRQIRIGAYYDDAYAPAGGNSAYHIAFFHEEWKRDAI
jgi:hypothetical protein